MTVDDAYEILRNKSAITPGRFYQAAKNLSLGVGKIYKDVRFPIINLDDFLFDTIDGLVLILTHECDIDQGNIRPFNDQLIICPIIPLNDFIAEYAGRIGDEEQLSSFLSNVASRHVNRVMYFPPLPPFLNHGGLIYLNQICSTHVLAFNGENVEEIGAVSAYGLVHFDKHLTNHLLRPKAEILADY